MRVSCVGVLRLLGVSPFGVASRFSGCGCALFRGRNMCLAFFSGLVLLLGFRGMVVLCFFGVGICALHFSRVWCCFSVFGVWLCSVLGSAYVPCIFPGFGVVFSCLRGNLGHWRMFGSCVWGLSFLSLCVLFSALVFASCLLGGLQPNENHIRYQLSNLFEPIFLSPLCQYIKKWVRLIGDKG